MAHEATEQSAEVRRLENLILLADDMIDIGAEQRAILARREGLG